MELATRWPAAPSFATAEAARLARELFGLEAEAEALPSYIDGPGVELVRDRETLEPAAGLLAAAIQEARESGVLLGSDGPLHDVLKIKPPMDFGEKEAEVLLDVFERALASALMMGKSHGGAR